MESAVAALPERPPIWNKLRRHQRTGFLAGVELRKIALHYEMGMGKTLLSIALARYFRRAGVARQFLVLVPMRVNKDEWVEQVVKHAPSTSYCVLDGSSRSKWDQLEATRATLVFETYAGLTRMVCAPVQRGGKTKLLPDRQRVAVLSGKFDGMIVDEAHNLKSWKSLQTRIARAMSRSLDVLIELTGTPFGRDPLDLWSQMLLLDDGHTLGGNLALYRSAFFTARHNGFEVEYKFKPDMRGTLSRFLAHCALRYKADESDLPATVAITKKIPLSEEGAIHYERVREELVAARGNWREIKNAFLRMRQISSGFVGFIDDESGARAKFTFKENPKLDLLMTQLSGTSDKAVVFHDFLWSAERIGEECEKLGIDYVVINGGVSDVRASRSRFVEDPECRVLLLSNAMATGLNLQVAKYAIFFEAPVPVIVRQQALRRVVRQESGHSTVFVIDLVMEDTVDERILQFHAEGRDLMRAILDENR